MILAGNPRRTGSDPFSILTPGPGEVVVGGADGPVMRFAPPVPRPTISALGDSITANGTHSGGAGERSWLMHACVASQGKLFWVDNVGAGGYKTQQILDDLTPLLLAQDPRPGYVAILAGANDTGVTPFADWKVSYTGILDRVMAAGIVPVICAIPPNATTSKHGPAAQFNLWLSLEARRRGVPWINWIADLMDPATGGDWKSGLAADGVHPTMLGAKTMGEALWREFSPHIGGNPSWYPLLATSNTDPQNLMTNGLMMTDSNADGLADGFGVNNHPERMTPSLVPGGNDAIGNWQRFTGLGDEFTGYANRITAVNPGDRVSVGFRMAADFETGPATAALFGIFQWPATISPAGMTRPGDETSRRFFIGKWQSNIAPTTFYQEYTIRDTTTGGIAFEYGMTGVGWFQIAQVTVRNLTALGLA